jgi:hypothetical protein
MAESIVFPGLSLPQNWAYSFESEERFMYPRLRQSRLI